MDDPIVYVDDVIKLFPVPPAYQMVDRAQLSADGTTARGVKCMSLNEPFFCGHFPAHPILPGVLQVESMNQLAILALTASGKAGAGRPSIIAMEKIKFRRPVVPGDVMVIEAEIAEEDGNFRVNASVSVEGETASEAVLLIGFAETTAQVKPLTVPCSRPLDGELMDIEGIMSHIPHRYPFLLIDRAYAATEEDKPFVAIKNVTANEPIFSTMGEHNRVLPNFLIPEIAAQAGCACVLSQEAHAGKIAYFMSIDKANFMQDIVPGDQLVIETSVVIIRDRFGKSEATVYVGEDVVASCSLKFAVAKG